MRYCLYIAKKILSKSIIEIFYYEKNISMETKIHEKNNTHVYFLKRHIFLVCCMFFQLREEGIERIGEAIGRSSEQVPQDACFFGR